MYTRHSGTVPRLFYLLEVPKSPLSPPTSPKPTRSTTIQVRNGEGILHSTPTTDTNDDDKTLLVKSSYSPPQPAPEGSPPSHTHPYYPTSLQAHTQSFRFLASPLRLPACPMIIFDLQKNGTPTTLRQSFPENSDTTLLDLSLLIQKTRLWSSLAIFSNSLFWTMFARD